MFQWQRRRNRRRIRAGRLSPSRRHVLEARVPWVRGLSAEDLRELAGHVLVFLAEKRFEGAGGLAITDEIEVTIAGHACSLIMHRETDYYPGLSSIVVYPDAYSVPRTTRAADGTVEEFTEVRQGESWSRGAVVLSWQAVVDAGDPRRIQNVVVHEFAHQLDGQSGTVDGLPLLGDPAHQGRWAAVLGLEYEALRTAVANRQGTLLRPYGATNPGEFFAVASEAFFMQPGLLRRHHPGLFDALKDFYRLDLLGSSSHSLVV